jgi:hypothetical protein
VGILVASYGAASMREIAGLALCSALIGVAIASVHSSLTSYFQTIFKRRSRTDLPVDP